jgi:hypothetical protein
LAADEFGAAEEIRKMKAQAVYDQMTDEQKLQVIQKRGQDALALAKETGLNADKLAYWKLRKEYEDLKSSMGKGAGGKSAGGAVSNADLVTGSGEGDRTMNAKGQLMRRGVVVSREDAVRTETTKGTNQEHAAKGEDQMIKSLDSIDKKLSPTTK